MKTFVTASFVAFAAVATAQLGNIPSCALSCFVGPLQSDGCSDLTDFACHCKKFDQLISTVTPCVQKGCSADDQAKTIAAVEQTCADAGVPVSVSAPAGSSTPAASPSATPEKSSTPAETPTPTPTPTAIMTVSSYAASSNTPKSTATPKPSGNGTIPTGSPSPTVSEFPGAAPRMTQAAGLLGAAAIALFAL